MGIEIEITTLTALMFGSLLVLLMAGLPLAFVTGGLACVFLFILGDWQTLNIVPSRIFPLMTNYQLSAIPLFIFLAAMLERAGIINEMFDTIYKLLGGVKGGLASATIIASTILAAMVGVIGAAVVTMGIIALPAMLKRGYDPKIAMGSIMAGGTLGILIPPSILAIIYAVVAEQSVGELFIGAVLPGLMLSGLYILYVSLMCTIDPRKGPPIPIEERVSNAEKLRLLGNMAAPITLIFVVLGVIFAGVATPVEAAGIGTFGAFIVAAIHRKLDWPTVREACMTTLKASSMVIWIMFGATIFVGLYVLEGGQEFVEETVTGLGLGPWGVLILMQVVLVALGMFLDWVGILLLAVPIFVPIVKGLGAQAFGLGSEGDLVLWFGVLYLVNMQMSFLSPPFGYALFYLRGVAPADIPMSDIFKSALPFLFLQIAGLVTCMLFPEVITWLPNIVYG
ncbi:TRAP transporter large permease subunit [Sediminimonas sp.]|jgi:tripartite ATP-independent transporter DctM subunit|uniref:TRAP transporter large permease n=1 Tax=Sediminimonas sp. TaxID=2823379 RepID=UPI0025FAC2F1|nr:TRAP transporter large permease subunit [Sediminimonas sp.]